MFDEVVDGALVMERRACELKEWLVLSQFYPSDGVPGVEEERVIGSEAGMLRHVLKVPKGQRVKFSRVLSLKGKAKEWYLVGDVVCRYDGLEEKSCDLLRRVQDRVFIGRDYRGEGWEGEVESSRRESIERHQWTAVRSKETCGVIDPVGRLLLVVRRTAHKQWGFAMEKLMPRMSRSRATGPVSVEKLASAWCAMKAVHRHFHFVHDGEITMSDVSKSEQFARGIFMKRMDLGKTMGSGRYLRMYPFKLSHRAFWERAYSELESGESVPSPVRHMYKHRSTVWLRVSADDVDGLLGLSWWPEWVGAGPVRFEKIKKGEKSGQNWH